MGEPLNLGQLAQLIKGGGTTAGTCAACEKPFTCGAKLSGCWCAEIELNDETRAQLRSRYSDCLCRECLEKLAED
jgi:hypothetical protein